MTDFIMYDLGIRTNRCSLGKVRARTSRGRDILSLYQLKLEKIMTVVPLNVCQQDNSIHKQPFIKFDPPRCAKGFYLYNFSNSNNFSFIFIPPA